MSLCASPYVSIAPMLACAASWALLGYAIRQWERKTDSAHKRRSTRS
jgi:hypothetical protein